MFILCPHGKQTATIMRIFTNILMKKLLLTKILLIMLRVILLTLILVILPKNMVLKF